MDQKVLVTGGAGFLGSYLVNGLLDHGYQVRATDKEDLAVNGKFKNVEFIKADIRDRDSIDKATANVDFIFHNASLVPVSRSSKRTFREVNVEGTQNVLEAAFRNKVRKVIYISSSAPYGIPQELPISEKTRFNPVCDYGRSKVEAEGICREYRNKGLDIIILRPRTIVGKTRLGILQILYSWIADHKNVYILGRGNNLYQSLAADDLADACVLCLQKECRNEDFNLGADRFGTFKEDIQGLIDHANSSSTIKAIPANFARTLLRPLDILNLVPFTTWHYMTADKDFYFDSSKASRILGWHPKKGSLEMFQESYDWYIAHRDEADSKVGRTHRDSVDSGILKMLK